MIHVYPARSVLLFFALVADFLLLPTLLIAIDRRNS